MIIHWGLPNMMSGYVPGDDKVSAVRDYVFLPGNNAVPDEKWAKIKKHPLIQNYMDSGTLREVVATDVEHGLRDLKEPEAIRVIKETYDNRLLKAWNEKEKRAKISKAIETQLADIEAKTKKEKSKDDDDDEDE